MLYKGAEIDVCVAAGAREAAGGGGGGDVALSFAVLTRGW